MSEAVFLVFAGFQGALLGAVFFGGLWWTVRRAVSSPQPGIWFLASLVLRTLIVLAGFWLASHGDWRRLVACLIGFSVARVIVVRFTGPPVEKGGQRLREGEA